MLVGLSELARLSGTTRQRALYAAKAGHLERLADGLFDTESVRNARWMARVSKGKFRPSDAGAGSQHDGNGDVSNGLKPFADAGGAIDGAEWLRGAGADVSAVGATAADDGGVLREAVRRAAGGASKGAAARRTAGIAAAGDKTFNALADDIRREIERSGDAREVEVWSKIMSNTVAAYEKSLRIQQKRGELLPKNFVLTNVFGYLDVLSERILDCADQSADSLIAMVESEGGSAREKIVEALSGNLSALIGDAKSRIIAVFSEGGKSDGEEGLREMVEREVAEVLERGAQ